MFDCSTIPHVIVQTLTTDKKKKFDLRCSKAVHTTAKPIQIFDHELWIDFPPSLLTWKLPSPERLEGKLLNVVYKDVMEKFIEDIKCFGGRTLSIDEAIHNLASLRIMSFYIRHARCLSNKSGKT